MQLHWKERNNSPLCSTEEWKWSSTFRLLPVKSKTVKSFCGNCVYIYIYISLEIPYCIYNLFLSLCSHSSRNTPKENIPYCFCLFVANIMLLHIYYTFIILPIFHFRKVKYCFFFSFFWTRTTMCIRQNNSLSIRLYLRLCEQALVAVVFCIISKSQNSLRMHSTMYSYNKLLYKLVYLTISILMECFTVEMLKVT